MATTAFPLNLASPSATLRSAVVGMNCVGNVEPRETANEGLAVEVGLRANSPVSGFSSGLITRNTMRGSVASPNGKRNCRPVSACELMRVDPLTGPSERFVPRLTDRGSACGMILVGRFRTEGRRRATEFDQGSGRSASSMSGTGGSSARSATRISLLDMGTVSFSRAMTTSSCWSSTTFWPIATR